jgi:phosphoglycolate phosphatase
MKNKEKKYTFEGIIFDFDLTLADSSKGAIECIQYAFKELNLPIPSSQNAKRTIGLSLSDTFLNLTENKYHGKIKDFSLFFIERANEVMVDLTVLFKETPQVIDILKKNGLMLGIVSTKFRMRIEAILHRDNLLDAFNVIIGGEDVSEHKPNPKSLLLAIEKLKIPSSKLVYVGDTITDAETAKRAGISFIAVLSGSTPINAFLNYKPYGIINNISELQSLIGIL